MRRSLIGLVALCVAPSALAADSPGHDQAPGQQFHITAESLPQPGGGLPPGHPPKTIPRGEHLPLVPEGFAINLYLDEVDSPRRLIAAKSGLVFMSQQSTGGLIVLLDSNSDGVPDYIDAVSKGANNPFGMGIITGGPKDGDMVLADSDSLTYLPIMAGGNPERLTEAEAFGPAEGHITREVAIDPKTNQIYVGVGSMSNLSADEPPMKATIQRFDSGGKNAVTFATGLRNVTGMDFEPTTGALYGVVMERDGMGDALVPDFLARIDEGDNFGWPYQYTGGNVQPGMNTETMKLAAAKTPDVLFEAHSAPLDMAFIPDSWPEEYRGDALVALHGSWEAASPRGYKVVRVHFTDGTPDGTYENFITGFWVSGEAPAEVWGRPCSLAFTPDGALLMGDDWGKTIWRIIPPGWVAPPPVTQ